MGIVFKTRIVNKIFSNTNLPVEAQGMTSVDSEGQRR